MGVTHVVRGDDLLTAAPRNIAVIRALGGTPPIYAHVPQVVGPDRKPLSKRHGSTSVQAFREQGFLPEALVNYLALLGWSPGDDREQLSREELVAAFDLSRVSSNPAAFDPEKLTWLNNRYIQTLDDDDLAARCVHFLVEAGVGVDPVLLRSAMPLVKERMKTLTEVVDLLRFLFSDDIVPNPKAADILCEGSRGLPQGSGRGTRCLSGMGSRTDRADAGRAGRAGRAEPHQGVAADPRGRDRLERVAAAAGVLGAARPRSHTGARTARRGLIRAATAALATLSLLGGASVSPVDLHAAPRYAASSVRATGQHPEAADRVEADPLRAEAPGRDGGLLEAALRDEDLAAARRRTSSSSTTRTARRSPRRGTRSPRTPSTTASCRARARISSSTRTEPSTNSRSSTSGAATRSA